MLLDDKKQEAVVRLSPQTSAVHKEEADLLKGCQAAEVNQPNPPFVLYHILVADVSMKQIVPAKGMDLAASSCQKPHPP